MKKTSLKNDSPRPEPAKPDGVWEVSDSPFMFDPSPVPTLEEIKLARRRRRRQRSEQALQRLLAEEAQLRREIIERRRRSGQ
ncbi:MAG TPA: hypothetical protein PKI20_11915 [Verrucomicrobiota bacterium]|jgi:hypothetical protein|nr:hypothetical protein [Verrucomicrobiota bacterium]HQL78861.1 hypothetical protein [Verrucomicrobiota bacterium]